MTKGAIGNLINRYRSVLNKCRLNNMLAKMFIAGTVVLAAPLVAEAAVGDRTQTITQDVYNVLGPKITTGNAAADTVDISVIGSKVTRSIIGIWLQPAKGTVSEQISARDSKVSVSSGSSTGTFFYGQYLNAPSGSASALNSTITVSDSKFGTSETTTNRFIVSQLVLASGQGTASAEKSGITVTGSSQVRVCV